MSRPRKDTKHPIDPPLGYLLVKDSFFYDEAFRNFRQTWKAEHPGVEMLPGRPTKLCVVWRACASIWKTRTPQQLQHLNDLSKLVRMLKEELGKDNRRLPDEGTIRKYAKRWLGLLPRKRSAEFREAWERLCRYHRDVHLPMMALMARGDIGYVAPVKARLDLYAELTKWYEHTVEKMGRRFEDLTDLEWTEFRRLFALLRYQSECERNLPK